MAPHLERELKGSEVIDEERKAAKATFVGEGGCS